MSETLWTFKTRNFRITLTAEPEDDLDLSWCETGETGEKLESGEWVAFCAKVAVYLNGAEIAADYLGQCIYANAADFATGHRDPDPMNRNCSLNDRNICHYFPDMVATAISEARDYLRNIPDTRAA